MKTNEQTPTGNSLRVRRKARIEARCEQDQLIPNQDQEKGKVEFVAQDETGAEARRKRKRGFELTLPAEEKQGEGFQPSGRVSADESSASKPDEVFAERGRQFQLVLSELKTRMRLKVQDNRHGSTADPAGKPGTNFKAENRLDKGSALVEETGVFFSSSDEESPTSIKNRFNMAGIFQKGQKGRSPSEWFHFGPGQMRKRREQSRSMPRASARMFWNKRNISPTTDSSRSPVTDSSRSPITERSRSPTVEPPRSPAIEPSRSPSPQPRPWRFERDVNTQHKRGPWFNFTLRRRGAEIDARNKSFAYFELYGDIPIEAIDHDEYEVSSDAELAKQIKYLHGAIGLYEQQLSSLRKQGEENTALMCSLVQRWDSGIRNRHHTRELQFSRIIDDLGDNQKSLQQAGSGVDYLLSCVDRRQRSHLQTKLYRLLWFCIDQIILCLLALVKAFTTMYSHHRFGKKGLTSERGRVIEGS